MRWSGSAISFAAAATTRLRFTTMVANQDLRHPAVLAREVATLDVLSAGRFEVGLGAGWNEEEHRQLGLPFPEIKERADLLELGGFEKR